MPQRKKSARTMSAEHKQALAEGRTQGRAIRAYLEALEATRPRRGRKRSPESIKKRLAAIESSIDDAGVLKKAQLIQERIDLTAELEATDTSVDLEQLERGFVEAAGPYSQRKGISFAAWREMGVPAPVLRAAGIARSS